MFVLCSGDFRSVLVWYIWKSARWRLCSISSSTKTNRMWTRISAAHDSSRSSLSSLSRVCLDWKHWLFMQIQANKKNVRACFGLKRNRIWKEHIQLYTRMREWCDCTCNADRNAFALCPFPFLPGSSSLQQLTLCTVVITQWLWWDDHVGENHLQRLTKALCFFVCRVLRMRNLWETYWFTSKFNAIAVNTTT